MNSSLLLVRVKSLWRRRLISFLLIAIAASGVVTSIVLQSLTDRQQIALDETISNTPIHCTLTNSKGLTSDHLGLPRFVVQQLTGRCRDKSDNLDDYVKNVHALSTGNASLTSLESEQKLISVLLKYILSFESDPALSPLEGTHIELYDGFNEEIFRSDKQVCLVSENLIPAGKSLTQLTFTTDDTVIQAQVIGIVSGVSDVIYCPFFMNLNTEFPSRAPVDSCTFDIRDNHQLQESRDALFEWFMDPTQNAHSSELKDFGVLILDETYQNTVHEIESNLDMLRFLRPLLLVLWAVIGYLSGYLTARTRMREFAVERCLGMKKQQIFLLVLFEQALLTLIGILLGGTIGWIVGEHISAEALLSAGLLSLLFLLGNALSSLSITRINVMKLMKVED